MFVYVLSFSFYKPEECLYLTTELPKRDEGWVEIIKDENWLICVFVFRLGRAIVTVPRFFFLQVSQVGRRPVRHSRHRKHSGRVRSRTTNRLQSLERLNHRTGPKRLNDELRSFFEGRNRRTAVVAMWQDSTVPSQARAQQAPAQNKVPS